MIRCQRHFILSALLLSTLLLDGCSGLTTRSGGAVDMNRENTSTTISHMLAAETADKSAPSAPFPTETLFDLLVAEIAADRQEFRVTLFNYAKQAHMTRDPQITERATHIAVMLNAEPYVIDLSSLWLELEPDNIEANRIAAYFLTHAGQLNKAFPHALFMLQQGESDLLRNISLFAANGSDEQRQQLLDQFQQLPPLTAMLPEVLLSKATLLWQQGHTQQSLDIVKQLSTTNLDNKNAVILMAQLLIQQGDTDTALSVIKKALHHDTSDNLTSQKQLRVEYARVWALKGDLERSRQELSKLVVQHPNDSKLLYTLAILSAEVGLEEDAELLFRRLLNDQNLSLQANYNLAKMLDRQGHTEEAMAYYRDVRRGPDMIKSAIRLSQLMAQQNQLLTAQLYLQQLRTEQPDQAISLIRIEADLLIRFDQLDSAYDLLSNGLKDYPDNITLLYTRSLVGEKQGQYRQMETDLRTALALDPNNPVMLNALGYALSNHSSNYQEAYQLINKALKLDPDDAATLDSMGWILYRLKRLDEALSYLEKAYAIMKDPEIAAHLGEVLWASERKQDAIEIWQRGLESDPDATIITRTMKRLKTGPLTPR